MLTLNDGRAELWQWDTGRTLAVDADCSQVHFSNKVFGRSIDVDVVDGTAIIPDVLLQTDKDLNVWAFVGTADNGYTKISKTFKVNRRNKPADYVFTPTDQITLQTIQRQIGDISDLTTEAKENLVAAINEAAASGGSGSMDLRVADGYVQYSTDGGSTWKNLIAMANLKGDPGATGEKGTDGKSAYAYAVEGGYTGTEAEFAEKLASDALIVHVAESNGTLSADKTYADIRDAILAGTTVLVDYGGVRFPLISMGNSLFFGATKCNETSVATVIIEIASNDEVHDFSAQVDSMPNPNAMTFTGAVTGSYDGSEPLTVEIPRGGSGGSDTWNLIDHITAEDASISYAIPLQPGAKEYGIYWKYTMLNGKTPQRSIMVDESLAEWGVMYRCSMNELLFIRVYKGPSNILATGQNVAYSAPRFTNGGTNIGSGTDFPAMTLTTNIACTTSEIWVYWR